MSIFAISDLHLSFNKPKPMDIFGDNWSEHEEKIRRNWIGTVKEDDLVLLPGDFSWAMYLEETYKDFEYLSKLPGKKLLLKGNHDYWWTTITSMRNYLERNNFKNIDFIYNNSYEYEDYIIVGTRGWMLNETDKENLKILRREVERLKLSINNGINQYGSDKKMIVCMHYPPLKEKITSDFLEVMKQYNIEKCIYGHLHGPSQKDVVEGIIDGIEFKMVSCDYTNFNLIKLV